MPGSHVFRFEEVLQQNYHALGQLPENENEITETISMPGSTSTSNEIDMKDVELIIAIEKTGRAVGMGLTLAAMDGPLPILDVAGFAVATFLTFRAWSQYLQA